MELTTDLITQLGFPAAIAGFLVWYVATNLSNRIDTLAENNSKMIDKLGQRIDRNTETVAYLAVVLARANGLDPDELKKYVVQSGDDNA